MRFGGWTASCLAFTALGCRAILLGVYPDYKLIIQGDPDSTLDTPSFEFYNIGAPGYDVNEQIPLDTASLTGTALDAYNAYNAKDLALGGGYSDPPGGGFDTVYIELPASGVRPPVPPLTRPIGNPLKAALRHGRRPDGHHHRSLLFRVRLVR